MIDFHQSADYFILMQNGIICLVFFFELSPFMIVSFCTIGF